MLSQPPLPPEFSLYSFSLCSPLYEPKCGTEVLHKILQNTNMLKYAQITYGRVARFYSNAGHDKSPSSVDDEAHYSTIVIFIYVLRNPSWPTHSWEHLMALPHRALELFSFPFFSLCPMHADPHPSPVPKHTQNFSGTLEANDLLVTFLTF